jgi:hypothetical protein
VVSVEDLSAKGKAATPRALKVDISTLRKGSYVVQLEINVATATRGICTSRSYSISRGG